MDQSNDKQAILEQALLLVPFEGWSDTMLHHALEKVGFVAANSYRFFPHGVRDLVEYFMRMLDVKMVEQLELLDLSQMRIRDRIQTAVLTRLTLLEPYKATVSKTLSYYSLHPVEATQSLYKTTDEMWHQAGDTTTDFNHYSKRIILAGVYSSTLLYWLHDTSDGYADTHAFLERRIDDALAIGTLKHKFCSSSKAA